MQKCADRAPPLVKMNSDTSIDMNPNSNIEEAKSRLPLPKLMAELDYGDRAKSSARCMFHDDHSPSFGIYQNSSGEHKFKCHACGAAGDAIDFLAKVKGIDNKEATKEFLRMAGVESKAKPTTLNVPVSVPKQPGGTEAKPTPILQLRPLGELLDAVVDVLQSYVSFQFIEQPRVIALWVLHTWVFEASYFTPYLHVFSAETSSGKSRLLEVLVLLVNKPWKLDSGSTATIFRRIETDKPTLLYDEIDNVFRGNGKDDDTKDLRACLNSGFKWDGKFSRCVGQNANLEVKEFATFSPKALAGIGKVLSDTLSNRCIPIQLSRQMREEKVKRFREREAKVELARLRNDLETYTQLPTVIDELRAAKPALPDQLTDRQQDICEPLLAIAEKAGRKWLEFARTALVKLCSTSGEDVSTGIKLLGDIKRIFEGTDAEGMVKADKLPTIDILNRLVAVEDDRPWALWWEDALKYGKAQGAASRLAKMLKKYGINRQTIRLEDGTHKGYVRTDFLEAWERYLPTEVTRVTGVTYEGKNVAAAENVTAVTDVTASAELGDGLEITASVSDLLPDLVSRIGADGAFPKGHLDCVWGDDYPHEYTSAMDYLDSGNRNEAKDFDRLSGLTYKIDCEAGRGQPLLTADGALVTDWPEYRAALAYVNEQMAKLERDLLAA